MKGWEAALGKSLQNGDYRTGLGETLLVFLIPVARLFLYLAVLCWIQRDAVARAWYVSKVKRQGGLFKSKAVIALMRKLALGLWHVARGAEFDSTLLFDTLRLGLDDILSHRVEATM